MFKSMTGFAQKEFESEKMAGSIQLKSYNNRYLDVSITLPPQLSVLEAAIRQFLSERLVRGKVEFSIHLRKFEFPISVKPDTEAAKTVYAALSLIGRECGIEQKPTLELVASMEGVLRSEKEMDTEALWPALQPLVQEIFEEYEAVRSREGEATERNIFGELARLESGLEKVKANLPVIESTIKSQLKARFDEMLVNGYDEQRFLQEVAVQLMHFGINEEVSRLAAHLDAFRAMSRERSPAKKLDFLCQEMNREVNTIGSKNMLVEVAHTVVEMKDALENIREQLRNVE
ncbi:MAG: YicC family protein [Spirochaetaceae bacterium]|nr:YicC family protein [Spirochaetaceae bacterium]